MFWVMADPSRWSATFVKGAGRRDGCAIQRMIRCGCAGHRCEQALPAVTAADPTVEPSQLPDRPSPAAKLLAETSPCYRLFADWLRHPHHLAEQSFSMSQHWDVEADVVVVGFGAAGMAASV